jgi:hypothetical protein
MCNPPEDRHTGIGPTIKRLVIRCDVPVVKGANRIGLNGQ